MNRIVGAITGLAEHVQAVVQQPEQYRPRACPHCGLSGVWHHGRYYRKADRSEGGESLNPVAVLRFVCRGCKRTCSRLPACIAPRRWYDWFMQQAVLLLWLSGLSVHGCARCSGRARHTVRRWCAWLGKRHEQYAFFLRSRRLALGRYAEFESFWRNVIEELTLQQAMCWLDHDLIVP